MAESKAAGDMSGVTALLDSKEIQFVFVGGKGGVGKTTCSCALALQCAKRREGNVLLISTDPAHNLSDALMQQFENKPTQVKGTRNLFAMETDPAAVMEAEINSVADGEEEATDGMVSEFRQWISSVPGIDEAMALSTVLRHVESGEYELIVFDTAPTGHTLRLLQLPMVLKVGLEKLNSWKAKLGGVMGSISAMVYADSSAEKRAESMRRLEAKLQEYNAGVTKISAIFRDQQRTQFVCVCIAEHLSVFETLRLISELKAASIASRFVLVNQLVPQALAAVTPEEGGAAAVAAIMAKSGASDAVALAVREACELCGARARIQAKYLGDLRETLKDTHVTIQLPLLPAEVRGVANLSSFSDRLLRLDPKLDPKAGAERAANPLAQLEFNPQGAYEAATAAKFMNKTAAMATDVAAEEAPELGVGDKVRLVGLKNAGLNGSEGSITEYVEAKARWRVKLANRTKCVAVKPANLLLLQKAPAAAPAVPSAITPEMMQMVQSMLMKPGGVQEMLAHPAVQKLKQDPTMTQFFSDLETQGMFGAMSYLSNKEVMAKVAMVAKEIQASR